MLGWLKKAGLEVNYFRIVAYSCVWCNVFNVLSNFTTLSRYLLTYFCRMDKSNDRNIQGVWKLENPPSLLGRRGDILVGQLPVGV